MNRHDAGNLIEFDDDDFDDFVSPPPPPPPGISQQSHNNTNTNTGNTSRTSSQPNLQQSKPSSPSPPPPPPLTHASTTSASSGYGIGSAVWGLFRRISTVDSTTSTTTTTHTAAPTSPHLSSQGSGGRGDGINGAFTPPRRAATPRGLPSLDPVNLHGYRDDTEPDERLLARGVAEEIRTFLPERLKIMEDWRLVYSLYQNGSSLATLYQLCEKYRGVRAGFVLVVRDGKDGIFGAYFTEAPHPAPSYYGTGECFLWRASLHAPLPPPPSADTTNLNYRTTTIASHKPSTSSSTRAANGSSSSNPNNTTTGHLTPDSTRNNNIKRVPSPAPSTQSVRFQTFAYTGANDYCMFCETKFLSVGGGHGGTFGLWLNDSLSRGHSAECDTFLNQPLSEEGEKFDVIGVELWVVGAS